MNDHEGRKEGTEGTERNGTDERTDGRTDERTNE